MSKHQREDNRRASYTYHANQQVYERLRLSGELQIYGIPYSRKRVVRLMREQELSAHRCHHDAPTTIGSFFETLKSEYVECTSFHTRRQAKQTIFKFVECFYNRVCRHSSLGYINPVAYEQMMCSSKRLDFTQKQINLMKRLFAIQG